MAGEQPPRLEQRPWFWPALAALFALAAIPGIFTTTQVFYVRDLASWFLPHHLWFHHALFTGNLPLWYPYPGCGYATVRDATFQTLFPLTLPLRFLPPILGFNLIVALPFPLTAAGMFLFLRRHVRPAAACLGATVVAASGVFLSTANAPNLSWSAALLPWVLFGADAFVARPGARRFGLLSTAFGLMFLAGEPVTFAATAVVAMLYAGLGSGASSWRARAIAAGATAAAALAGVLLGAVQLFPLLEAQARSIRASGALGDMWSLHPARLVEFIVPFFFGKWVGMPWELTQWLFGLNDRREPLLMSMYVGAAALLLALIGATVAPRRRFTAFFSLAVPISLLAAFGSHTPLYAAARNALPLLAMLRYPSKLALITTVAIGVLAALGFDAISDAEPISRKRLALPVGVAFVLAAIAGSGMLIAHLYPQLVLSVGERFAATLSLPEPLAASRSFLARLLAGAPHLLAVAAAAGVFLLLSGSKQRIGRASRNTLFALVAFDLIGSNASINPTVEASALAPFGWVDKLAPYPNDRVFVSSTLGVGLPALDDAPPPPVYPPDVPPTLHQAMYDAAVANWWTGWNIRKTLSAELTGLRPQAYLDLLHQFSASDRTMRYRFLSWTGTRYYLVAAEPPMPSAALMRLPNLGTMALYESEPTGSRVAVLSAAEIEPDQSAQVRRLFVPEFDPSKTVLIDSAPPAPSGIPGAALPARAVVLKEAANSLDVEADAPQDAYLLLLDSYDAGWRVEVDGQRAPLLRADGVFRAVRVSAGRHLVRFVFRPRSLILGGALSVAMALGLLGMARVWRSHLL